jgi:hypothetical protein
MGSWKNDRPQQLKKIVYAMNASKLNKLVADHEDRGWIRASENKKHGYGLGCLVIWKNN